jgi:putative Ca2+/H+ antiporter (TMEM165/GDT1 family)
MEFLIAAGTAFILIFPVELPDKTFVATLVLATRYRALMVWLGVVAAFGVQCVVAVVAGRLITFLPEKPIQLVTAALFLLGAIILARSARKARVTEQQQEQEFEAKVGREPRTGLRAAAASFLVLFAAEWGDLSQLFTAGLVARGGHPVAVFVGSWTALAVVSGLAVLLGRVLLRYVSLTLVQYVGAALCLALATITLITALS